MNISPFILSSVEGRRTRIFITFFLLLSLSQQTNNLFAETLSDLVCYDEENTSFWFNPDLDKYPEAIENSDNVEIKNALNLLAENYYGEQKDKVDVEEMYGQTSQKIRREGLESIAKRSSVITKTIDVIKHIINNCSSKFNEQEFVELKKTILETAMNRFLGISSGLKIDDTKGEKYLELFNFLKPSAN